MVRKERKAALNVKDPEAYRLAQAIARKTGETLTRAVTEALRERYQRLHKDDPETLAADVRAIADRAAAHIKKPYLDHAQFLYNEHGLPRMTLGTLPLIASRKNRIPGHVTDLPLVRQPI